MTSPTVSLIVADPSGALQDLAPFSLLGEAFLTSGFSYEIVMASSTSPFHGDDPNVRWVECEHGAVRNAAIRKAVGEARGEVLALVTATAAPSFHEMGALVMLVHSGAASVAIGSSAVPRPKTLERVVGMMARMFLDPFTPDRVSALVFSAMAARKIFAESKIDSVGMDLELLYLANKYGFRVEHVPVASTGDRTGPSLFESCRRLVDVVRIRLLNRRTAYRHPVRCPVCFSAEVWSVTKTDDHVVRGCRRCKCLYLGVSRRDQSRSEVLPSHALSTGANQGNLQRRAAATRKLLSPGSRILEVGAGRGELGALLRDEFEYVGMDPSTEDVKLGWADGVELYCAGIQRFVNTGPAFDALLFFHSFGEMSDPHDALARAKELMKPGGILILEAVDAGRSVLASSTARRLTERYARHRIHYSQASLVELLEHSGFEIVTATSPLLFRSRSELMDSVKQLPRWAVQTIGRAVDYLPDPLLLPSEAIRVVAKRRAGSRSNFRTVRAVEPTHAR